jgi:hypothetical protein
MAMIESASRAFVVVADDRCQVRATAVLARTFLPNIHVKQAGHKGRAHQVEGRLAHEAAIAGVDIDEYARIVSSDSHQLFVHSPHNRSMQHAQIAFQVPSVGKRRLPRW